ncbi:MAG: hypothetical protein JRI23_32625 [Deltaproteobacteria bacterium]|jgi:hypothetical protein|nr:hypothetical protein [Deltaproteobacteria bacterium]MBW2536997.1 hypothetical protein [Deltaproteobacteria bacterium]
MSSDPKDPARSTGADPEGAAEDSGPAAFAPTALPGQQHGSIYWDDTTEKYLEGRSPAERSYVEQISSGRAAVVGSVPPPRIQVPTEPAMPAIDPKSLPRTQPAMPAVAPPATAMPTLPSASGSAPHATPTGMSSQPSASWPTAPPSPTGPPVERSVERSGWMFLGGMVVVLVGVLVVAVLIWVAVRVLGAQAPGGRGGDGIEVADGALEELSEQQLLKRLRRAGWSADQTGVTRNTSPYVELLVVPIRHPKGAVGQVSLTHWSDAAAAERMVEQMRSQDVAPAIRFEGTTVLAVYVVDDSQGSKELLDALCR